MSGPIRLLVGSDSAGFDYKDRIFADMQADDRVEVIDLGVFAEDLDGSRTPRWPSRRVRRSWLAKRTARSWSVALALGSRLPPTRCPASARPLPTTRSASSGRYCPMTARS